MKTARTARLAALLLFRTLLDGRPAQALDPFEVQVYDGSADAPGTAGVEMHLNGVVDGIRTAPPPEIAPHHTAHLTLEPSYGVFSFWELGFYLQSAVRPDGGYDFAGIKLRSKLVTPRDWHPSLRLGANVEVSYLPARYEAERWGAELRPIAAWQGARWLLAVNPILDFSFGGGGGTPAFEPAAAVLIRVHEMVSIGAEYYAGLGPIDAPAAWRDQQQIIYQVINIEPARGLDLNLGVG
ncbi:MAG TPA: hypothetical protein VFH68_00070, partial [Polyangia bacterium]|nr:hypothetical protein [Polyangia bacterium]